MDTAGTCLTILEGPRSVLASATSRLGAGVRAAVLASCLFFTLSVPAATAASKAVAGDGGAIVLTAGHAVFWDGEFVENAFNPSADSCTLFGEGCFTYRLHVAEPGSRLRVAIDHPSVSDAFDIRLLDPGGSDVTDATQRERGAVETLLSPVYFSHEVFVDDPDPGLWTVRVNPTNVSRSGFRMRAKLEKPVKEPSSKRRIRLLPNLQMVPPYELTFNSGSAQESDAPSCRADEPERYADHFDFEGPPRCLRFSAGPTNVGQGRWEVDLRPPPGQLEGTAKQRVYYSDGSYEEREAGTFKWHEEHRHYHHTAIGGFELFEVSDPSTGALEHRSFGPKIGYCTGDVVMAEWRSVRSDPPRTGAETGSGACSAPPLPGNPAGGVFGLTKGWGDIYSWTVEGNFVPFPADGGDGLYVVRVASDTGAEGHGTFAETNDSDNVAYAYIRVSGDSIEVLERGRGMSPWDPAKTEVQDTRRANPDCPPSATQAWC